MAATFSWRVSSLKTDPSDDNYIFEAFVNIYGTEGSVTKMTSASCVFPGKKADVADFKSLDDLKKAENESIIVDWVKDGFTEYKVTKLENTVQDLIDKHNGTYNKEKEVKADETSYPSLPEVTPDPDPTPSE